MNDSDVDLDELNKTLQRCKFIISEEKVLESIIGAQETSGDDNVHRHALQMAKAIAPMILAEVRDEEPKAAIQAVALALTYSLMLTSTCFPPASKEIAEIMNTMISSFSSELAGKFQTEFDQFVKGMKDEG